MGFFRKHKKSEKYYKFWIKGMREPVIVVGYKQLGMEYHCVVPKNSRLNPDKIHIFRVNEVTEIKKYITHSCDCEACRVKGDVEI
jgi:hypothetical protein